MCHIDMLFMKLIFYGKNPHHFGWWQNDLGIFFPTKSAAVHLFHQYKIILMI